MAPDGRSRGSLPVQGARLVPLRAGARHDGLAHGPGPGPWRPAAELAELDPGRPRMPGPEDAAGDARAVRQRPVQEVLQARGGPGALRPQVHRGLPGGDGQRHGALVRRPRLVGLRGREAGPRPALVHGAQGDRAQGEHHRRCRRVLSGGRAVPVPEASGPGPRGQRPGPGRPQGARGRMGSRRQDQSLPEAGGPADQTDLHGGFESRGFQGGAQRPAD
mmetsp:Transcript_44452/g.117508  ORF Transcript_44452/g.117508 Transcript_44452/m.117508 type:complete len:219 (-) Transcript_44452:218-874(-)